MEFGGMRGWAAIFVGLVGCLSSAAYAQDRTGVTDTAIKIGVPGPLTGPNASFGAAVYGIQAYYNYVNEKGGVHGRKIEIILGDDACNEAKGIAAAKKLISQDQVFLLNGGVCSGVALAMRPVVEESGVPWVVSTAVNQKISNPLAKGIFHASQTSEAAGQAFAKFMLSKPDTKKVGIIAHTNEWARGYRDPMVEALKAKGLTPVAEVVLERGQTDATAQVLKLKEAGLDFVVAILYEPEIVVFLRDSQKLGLDALKFGGLGADFQGTEKRLGSREPMKNFYQLFQFKDLMDGPGMKVARDIIEPRLPAGEKLTDFSFYGPGSAAAIVNVLQKIGRDLTREKFIAEMEKLQGFDTGMLAGKLNYSATNHQGAMDLYTIGYDQSGKIAVYESWGKLAAP
jgi:branched-chain amino acid transport system substrate-binding protein